MSGKGCTQADAGGGGKPETSRWTGVRCKNGGGEGGWEGCGAGKKMCLLSEPTEQVSEWRPAPLLRTAPQQGPPKYGNSHMT